MAKIQNASPLSAKPPYKDYDGNEITPAGKWLAGILIIFFTLCSAIYMIAHWPDRIPGPKENTTALYTNQWFNVRLIDAIIDTSQVRSAAPVVIADTTGTDTAIMQTDTNVGTVPLSGREEIFSPAQVQGKTVLYRTGNEKLIHINTLLLILVGVAGFLGNMIHIATSFTTFIGAGKFRKSWIMWYCVKPFTAAALAIAIYFVFRGGFLNMSDDSSNINIYGLMTISMLSGLFTDRATLKLKEVFDVLFRTSPQEERPDQLTNENPVIVGVQAAPLEAGVPVQVTITGEKLDEGVINVAIEDIAISDLERTVDSISFSYTLPEVLQDKAFVILSVKLDKNPVVTYPLKVKEYAAEQEG
ncbi:hypothetical protein [Chitinophaga rhizophila]|uniref:IPT/TIG domain-containing protein n=1 Tax=Chitinophaga rhizophila TaxID=2866212 RepID=A0ABS7GBL3_9BACT|nr:hypothetical protein [Chitinophaga rhizophila]MBW8685061.1 hypothetical protein [Chitinophaga rhizophila]